MALSWGKQLWSEIVITSAYIILFNIYKNTVLACDLLATQGETYSTVNDKLKIRGPMTVLAAAEIIWFVD